LLSSKIRSIETNSPLLLYAENQGNRSVLLGENIWKWRLQSHIDGESLLNLMSLWTKQFST
jgi:hypothetical protein